MGDRDYKPDRPIFCGNFEYDARQDEIEHLFDKYGPIEKIDMKNGFAFVYMMDKRDGDDAIRDLDRSEFGRRRRRLCCEWARGDGAVKQREDMRRRQTKPTTTLFVVNFDISRTTTQDLEEVFEPYGRLVRVQIKKNFAFIQYDTVEMAKEAKAALHQSRMGSRLLNVEFVAHEDHSAARGLGGGSDRGLSSDRDRDRDVRRPSRSPAGGRDARRRSRSPRRGSPPRRRASPPPRRRSPSPRRGSQPPRQVRDYRSPPRRRDASRSRSPAPPRRRSPLPPASRRSLSPR